MSYRGPPDHLFERFDHDAASFHKKLRLADATLAKRDVARLLGPCSGSYHSRLFH